MVESGSCRNSETVRLMWPTRRSLRMGRYVYSTLAVFSREMRLQHWQTHLGSIKIALACASADLKRVLPRAHTLHFSFCAVRLLVCMAEPRQYIQCIRMNAGRLREARTGRRRLASEATIVTCKLPWRLRRGCLSGRQSLLLTQLVQESLVDTGSHRPKSSISCDSPQQQIWGNSRRHRDGEQSLESYPYGRLTQSRVALLCRSSANGLNDLAREMHCDCTK